MFPWILQYKAITKVDFIDIDEKIEKYQKSRFFTSLYGKAIAMTIFIDMNWKVSKKPKKFNFSSIFES
jgi:hypothetical protein